MLSTLFFSPLTYKYKQVAFNFFLFLFVFFMSIKTFLIDRVIISSSWTCDKLQFLEIIELAKPH